MRFLVFDIGNTLSKVALFEDDRLSKIYRLENEELEDIVYQFMPLDLDGIIYSTVKKNPEKHISFLKDLDVELIQFSDKIDLPLSIKYETPKTLGLDRLANAVAAVTNFKSTPCLVIDAGTCIKYDFVNQFGEYYGGSISPGIKMRYKALHKFTDALPSLDMAESYYLIGRNTEESIHSGVLNGAIAEVKGIIEQYQMAQKDIKVIITGGDYLLFERNLKISIFADPNFTLKGLNEAAKFQFTRHADR
ncbi:MAG: type III pantothenate kinase [Flavobacteriales bacterium]